MWVQLKIFSWGETHLVTSFNWRFYKWRHKCERNISGLRHSDSVYTFYHCRTNIEHYVQDSGLISAVALRVYRTNPYTLSSVVTTTASVLTIIALLINFTLSFPKSQGFFHVPLFFFLNGYALSPYLVKHNFTQNNKLLVNHKDPHLWRGEEQQPARVNGLNRLSG